MKIIVSPAKTMIENTDSYIGSSIPTYIDHSETLLKEIRKKTYEELKEIWKCNEKIADENFERFKNMNLQGSLTPAIFSYQGIQYQYMAVNVMEASAIEYIRENLYILSGFFGILRAFDGVSPYRLEMQAKFFVGEHKNLYEFWGDKIYKKLFENCDIINIENLTNLEQCGDELFWFGCFPLKIENCDGSPIRAVAWFN